MAVQGVAITIVVLGFIVAILGVLFGIWAPAVNVLASLLALGFVIGLALGYLAIDAKEVEIAPKYAVFLLLAGGILASFSIFGGPTYPVGNILAIIAYAGIFIVGGGFGLYTVWVAKWLEVTRAELKALLAK